MNNEERHSEITKIAQRLYEEEGRPENNADEHWYRAEALYNSDHPAETGDNLTEGSS